MASVRKLQNPEAELFCVSFKDNLWLIPSGEYLKMFIVFLF